MRRTVRCCVPVLVVGRPQRRHALAVDVGAVGWEDTTVLLQSSLDVPSAVGLEIDPVSLSRFNMSGVGRLGRLGRPAIERRAARGKRPRKRKVDGRRGSHIDCQSQPYMCEEPFNCDKEPPEHELQRSQIATLDGHADFSAWCDSPYMAAAKECSSRNMTEYGRIMHQIQVKLSMGGRGIESMDAHYCFSFGHCDNHEVTESTTLQEAEAMCDRRFGHHEWAFLTFDEAMKNLAFFPDGDLHLGSDMNMYLGPRAEYSFAQMSCAMGSFHCDVMYCQQEYCNQPEFKDKYDRLRGLSGLLGARTGNQMH